MWYVYNFIYVEKQKWLTIIIIMQIDAIILAKYLIAIYILGI